MNAFELLRADHEKVAQLFERLESATGKAKLGVFDQIKTELELHTHIEEKIFYPALERPAETQELTAEAYEEHATVKNLLREATASTRFPTKTNGRLCSTERRISGAVSATIQRKTLCA